MAEPVLYSGNCVQELSKISEATVDLVVADPPYNLGKNYGNNSDSLEKKEYLGFTEQWLREADRILKPRGSLYVFMGFRYISHLYLMLEEIGLHFQGWITWHYTQGMGRKRGFSPRHDDILYFTKSQHHYTFNLDDVRVPQKYYRSRNNMRGANPGDVWEFSHVHYCQESRTHHPTQKPEGLIERMILASSNPGDLVVDPFAGSGTTLRVCQQTGRDSIGIEMNPEYCDMIKTRLGQPFSGFDGIDPRMLRIPDDLNDPTVRDQYRQDHKKWFLKCRPDSLSSFEEAFDRKYSVSKE
jgi:site-specific DNA-methyltransferase (adenine-specific)